MKARIFKDISNGLYSARINIEDVSQLDTQLIQKYGEPSIDLGGDFTGPPVFSLPSRLAGIVSDQPHAQSFDVRDFADAEDRADVWTTEVVARMVAAMVALRANVDTFTEEEVVTI